MKIPVVSFDFSAYDYLKFTEIHSDYRVAAIAKHGNQKYGDWPYAYHLAMVESTLVSFSFDSHAYRAAAWLHDVVEDTGTPINDITGMFGQYIAALVWACTGVGKNRKERNASIYGKLISFPDAAPIKVADRISNLKVGIWTKNVDKLSMYVKEHEEFTKHIKPLMMVDFHRKTMWSALDDIVELIKEYLCQSKEEQQPNQPE